MVNAPGLLSVYHVFDIAYPAKASNVYFFCAMLMGIEQDAKKKNSSKLVYFSPLRWLKTVSSTLKDANFAGWYNSLSGDAKIMVSKNCPILDKHVAVNVVAQLVTIATLWPAKNKIH